MTAILAAAKGTRVNGLRHFFRNHPALAALLVAATLALRVFVPGGYMPMAQGGTISVAICSSAGDVVRIAVPVDNTDPSHGQSSPGSDHSCAFGSLGVTALLTDPALLAAVLLFAFVAAIFGAPLLVAARRPQARPPQRGPPLTA